MKLRFRGYRSRRVRWCETCGAKVAKGARYVRMTTMHRRDIAEYVVCLNCAEDRGASFKDVMRHLPPPERNTHMVSTDVPGGLDWDATRVLDILEENGLVRQVVVGGYRLTEDGMRFMEDE